MILAPVLTVSTPLAATLSALPLDQVTGFLTVALPFVVEISTLPMPSRFCSDVVLMLVVEFADVEMFRLPLAPPRIVVEPRSTGA